MNRSMLFGALLMTGCGETITPAFSLPPITIDQRTPCLTPAMTSQTQADLARKMLRIAADRDCANDKIVAIDAILKEQEAANVAPRRNP